MILIIGITAACYFVIGVGVLIRLEYEQRLGLSWSDLVVVTCSPLTVVPKAVAFLFMASFEAIARRIAAGRAVVARWWR